MMVSLANVNTFSVCHDMKMVALDTEEAGLGGT